MHSAVANWQILRPCFANGHGATSLSPQRYGCSSTQAPSSSHAPSRWFSGPRGPTQALKSNRGHTKHYLPTHLQPQLQARFRCQAFPSNLSHSRILLRVRLSNMLACSPILFVDACNLPCTCLSRLAMASVAAAPSKQEAASPFLHILPFYFFSNAGASASAPSSSIES